jgi:hypothetical protein
MRFIIGNSQKWVGGTTLHYYFFDQESDGSYVSDSSGESSWVSWQGDSGSKDVVRSAFQQWKGLGLGLDFAEVKNRRDAEVRIGFMPYDGAWSYLGRDVLGISKNDRTMNFGWVDPDTALHEIAHTMGFAHEHQNPYAGIVWNEQKVISDLGRSPNFWSEETTRQNILNKLDPGLYSGSDWDRDSIMHYPFGAGQILEPVKYQTEPLIPAAGLSDQDREWALKFYPSSTPTEPEEEEDNVLKVGVTEADIQNGETRTFVLKPETSDFYQIKTLGRLDTVMVLFDSQGKKMKADDDSGRGFNAKIWARLLQGETYTVGVRLYYNDDAGDFKIRFKKGWTR